MSDFCKQCSEGILGEDFRDLVGLVNTPQGKASVLCEGCGSILVNNEGECQSHTPEEHKKIWRANRSA